MKATKTDSGNEIAELDRDDPGEMHYPDWNLGGGQRFPGDDVSGPAWCGSHVVRTCWGRGGSREGRGGCLLMIDCPIVLVRL